jgi:tetratricopeptide (TPR) repeat protein
LGNAHRKAGDLDAAERCFRQGLALDPAQAVIWVNLAAVLRLQGRPAESVECFASARRLGQHSPDVLDAMVGALLDASRVDVAFDLARQVTEQHPEFVPGHISLAHLQWEYGPPQSSGVDPLAELRRAAHAQADNQALQIALVGFLLEAKRSEEALQRLQQMRARADHPMLLTLQANALELLDRPTEAGPLYAQAHRIWGSSDAAFLNAYVRHLLKAGDAEQAAQRAQEALDTDPDNQESWAYLATAWRLLGDPRELWLCDYEQLIALLEVDVPDGFADIPQFLAALVDSLEILHQARTEPVRQSLRGGSQTPGRLFGRPEPTVSALQTVLLRSIERWLARLPKDPRHPFLRRVSRSVSFTGSWSVKLWTSGRHVNHYHSDGFMSSAFYVALPPSVRAPSGDEHAGHIQFGQPPLELALNLPPRRIIQPRAGYLALFPSYMWHGTLPFFDEQPRITVAFDMLPKA